MSEPDERDTKNISIRMSKSAYSDMSSIAEERGVSITDIFRMGLGFVKIMHEEEKGGNKLIVATPQGQVLKELVFPNPPVPHQPKEDKGNESLLRAIADLDPDFQPTRCTALAPFNLLRKAMPT
jgi:hypothetical protein